MMLEGIDVSNHQDKIDWHAVAASGRVFAAMKCTEGTGFRDPLFPVNWYGTQDAGMVRIAYHFARPSRNTPIDEARFFCETIERAGGLHDGDGIALDVEDTDVAAMVDLLPWSLAWLRAVRDVLGVRAYVYSGRWYLEPHGLMGADREGFAELAEHPLWLASWTNAVQPLPLPWSRPTLWQYTDKGTVPGIAGPVDLDRFFGTVEELRTLGFQPKVTAARERQNLIDVLNGDAGDAKRLAAALRKAADVLDRMGTELADGRDVAARLIPQ